MPNPDPTIAHGHLDVGWLENGLNLVDNEPQYYHYLGTDQQDIDDWGTRALITTLECGARLWLDNYWTGWDNKIKMIGIGDMSLQEGGSFPPHVGHQNGREVDIRYMRTDAKYGEEEGRLDLSDEEQRKLYDPQETVNVLNGLCGYGIQADRKYGCAVVVKIIVAKREWSLIFLEEGNPIELIYDESGEHDNHMHIVIEDPDGEGN